MRVRTWIAAPPARTRLGVIVHSRIAGELVRHSGIEQAQALLATSGRHFTRKDPQCSRHDLFEPLGSDQLQSLKRLSSRRYSLLLAAARPPKARADHRSEAITRVQLPRSILLR